MTGMTMFCLFEYIFPALLAVCICRATCSARWGKETPTSGTKARRICYGSEKNERFEAQPVQKHMCLIQVLVYLKKQKIERLIIQLKYLQSYVSLGCKVNESFLKPRFMNFSWEKMICLGQLNPHNARMVALRSKIHEFWAVASRRIHLQVDIGIKEPGINTRLYGFVQKWGIPQNCNFDWKMMIKHSSTGSWGDPYLL